MALSGRCGGAAVLTVALLSDSSVPAVAHGANPIRKVVTMLQMMQQKVEAEGKKEEEMFDKFMCYCQTGGSDLAKSIEVAEDKVPQLESGIESGKAEEATLKGDIANHNTDRDEAKAALGEAASLREKEAGSFAKESAQDKASISSLGAAIAAIEKGMGGFLQTKSADVVRSLSTSMDMSAADRDMLSSFLSTDQSQSAKDEDGDDDGDSFGSSAPQSGEIVGILKQMKETMEKDLADATAKEEAAVTQHDAMSKAKEAQLKALGRMIEAKTARLGELGVAIVQMGGDLDDTSKGLAEEKKFLADLETSCKTKKAETEARMKTRQEEKLAIADTIKILNDDDAADLFTKTLPAASFLQVKAMSGSRLRQEALEVMKSARRKHKSARLAVVAMAIRSKKTSFDKIKKMIDDMVILLTKEQADDDEKKEYCAGEMDATEDKLKGLNLDTSSAKKAIDDATEKAAAVADDIKALEAGIQELDTQVGEATDARKQEHEEFVKELAANNAAKELLGFAKNRLNKFYNPKLYKEAPKRELSAEDATVVAMGGELAPTAAPGGIAGTGISALQDANEDAPSFMQVSARSLRLAAEASALGGYQKQREESQGVLSLIDMLVNDVEKQIQEMKMEEEESQADYEETVQDSAAKRGLDAKTITEKEGSKSDLEEKLHRLRSSKKGMDKETFDTINYLQDLHSECDWLVSNHAVRKEARDEEMEALKKGKAVLSGASYSFLQTSLTHIHNALPSWN